MFSLVAFHTWLVKGIYSQQVAADAAGKLKEIKQLSQAERILLRYMYHQVRNLAVRMCQDRPVHCALINKIN